MDVEARAFAVVTDALADLDAEAVHRILDHVAKRHGYYVVTDLPPATIEFDANAQSWAPRAGEQIGEPLERRFEPPITADPHGG